ncbi:MAG: hypothetical protein ACYC0X_28965 [Pirellulaceae bacterium]
MANPLQMFRKYQYALLVGFGIMLMFAFVIAPPLSDYLQSRAGTSGGGNPVVVTWKSGELRESDIARLRTQHLLTTRFLESLVRRVEMIEDTPVELRGEPVTLLKGRSFPWVGRGMNANDVAAYQIAVDGEVVEVPQTAVRSIMPKVQIISPASSEEELVQRLILAEKAKELGVIISEGAIQDYLDNLSDASATSRPNYVKLLRDATGGRLDMKQLTAQLTMELAAQRMLILSQGGLYAAPPEMLYDCYNRLNRRVTAELLAVDVAGFIADIPEPTDQEVTALYEQGKDRFPFPLSSEPGFKRRQQISFGYFKGDFEEFLQREMDLIRPTITDEQIEKYYEANKASRFKKVELPSEPPAAPVQPPTDEAATPENSQATPPAAPAPEADTPAPVPPAGQEPATQPSPEPPMNSEPPTPATPENPPPAVPETPEEDRSAPSSNEESQAETPASEGVSLSSSRQPDITFVSYQADDPPAPQPDETAKEPAPADAAPAAETPATDPASPSPETSPAADPQAAGDTTPAEDASAPAAEDASSAPATPPAAEDATTQPEEAKPADPPVEYKPLDDALRAEIRDLIARDNARQPAQDKLEKAADDVRAIVERYAQQLSRSELLTGTAKPAPLDFTAIARDHQLVYEQTPLWDVLDISQIQQVDPAEGDPPSYEFARAAETLFSQQAGVVRRTLIDVGFAGDLAPFVPRRLVDGMLPQGGFPIPPEKLFVFWRTEVVPEAVPPLDEIRDQVVRTAKMQKALPKARAQAEEMATLAAESGKPLAEVFADNATKVIKSNPFSWMTRGAMPGSTSGQPMLSPVNGMAGDQPVTVAGAGNDFMQAVFDLDVGQVGVAVNEPQTFVYVIRIEGEEPPEEQRRAAFFAAGLTQEVNYLVQAEQSEIIRDWYSGLEKDYQVAWERDPIRDWNVE